MDDNQQVLKVVICGCDSAGKTSILGRLQHNSYSSNVEHTIGVQFVIHSVSVAGGKQIKFQCWDAAGQTRFRNLVKSYFKGAHVLLFVFDVSSYDTFNDLNSWIKESGWGCDAAGSGVYTSGYSKHCIAYIIGNKIDLKQRQVTFEDAAAFAKNMEMGYIEMSAKTGENVTEGFAYIAESACIFDKVITKETNGRESFFIHSDAFIYNNGNAEEDGSGDEVSVFNGTVKKKKWCSCFPRRLKREVIII